MFQVSVMGSKYERST